jgi:predicted naringenin-chalcone synthase
MRAYEAGAAPLAVAAARSALAESEAGPEQVAHLVTVSCTGFHAPGFDFALIRQLGLSPGVARTHLGFMGCHGALNGLRVARALALADPGSFVLLCAVELCSLHHACGWSMEKIIANSLFADGAAALVGRAGDRGGKQAWSLAASGSAVIPDSADAMTWSISDYGFEMTLSRRVPELIRQHLGRWLAWWLGRQGLTLDRVGSWAVHPGGPRILRACAETLGLADDQIADSWAVLEQCGNMSSPTILFILERLRQRRARLPCVALGFGPGMAVEAALIA